MAATPETSASGYATYTDLIAYHDSRKIADLVLDTGARETDLSSNTKITRALKRASGEVESACFRGRSYTPADLAALIANGGAGAELLIGLVCDLAFWHLCKRRHKLAVKAEEIAGAKEALEMLDAIQAGERIFSFTESAEAGIPATEIETVAQKYDRAGVASIASRYLGRYSRSIERE